MSGTGNSQPRLAGGVFIAFGLLIGVVLGVVFDQPSAGAVAGMAVGSAIAIVIWIMDSKRR
jgi:hypothetical protein